MRSILVGMMGLSLLAMSTGCPSDNNNTPDAGSCTCTPPKAEQVSYDHVSSGLGAENAQDALDELAARPVAEAPIEGRLQLVDTAVTNTGAALILLSQPCPQPTDIALGGGCGLMSTPGTKLLATTLTAAPNAGYSCNYEQPAGNMEQVHITVMCLHKAGQ
jgi:hypothetical protein